MAIRNIRTKGDEVLRKKCRNVDAINERTLTLIEDMIDTMYDAEFLKMLKDLIMLK